MEFIDSHCHLHDSQFFTLEQQSEFYERARQASTGIICVGTSQADSRAAVDFANRYDGVWSVVGVHPHDTKDGIKDIGHLLSEGPTKLVGIGEIGLDYYYNHSPRSVQAAALEQQLQWAVEYNLPVSFHVREAFDDFWPIYDNFAAVRGVLHSFTDTQANAEKALARGLYIGVNGISTFTKLSNQKQMYAELPLTSILLETDAPFLTPVPVRGKINEPSFVGRVADHLATQRNVSIAEVAAITTDNTKRLFGIN